MNGWTDTSRTLPTEHEYVRFVVTGHSQALLGDLSANIDDDTDDESEPT